MSEERKLILKLGQMITDRIGHKVTVDDPEYWGLAEVLTDEMAEVCLSMKVRKPMTLKEIAKKSGKDKERVQKLLDEMSVIGMIEYNWENEDRHKQYVLPMFVPGCAEFMMMNKKQTEEHPIIADFFENMSRLPLEKVTPMVPPGGSGIGMHVIPVEKAIPAHQQSASVEHISHWLKKYQDKYAVGACSCRRQQRMRGEGCGEIEGDLCIGVGDMADYLVETGKGRYIDLDEVMEILERAERNGFVHQITPAPHTGHMWRKRNAWRAENVSRSVLWVRRNLDRSCVQSTARSGIRRRCFRIRRSGDGINGILTTEIMQRSTATRRVHRRARQPVRRISLCRAISGWQQKADIWTL